MNGKRDNRRYWPGLSSSLRRSAKSSASSAVLLTFAALNRRGKPRTSQRFAEEIKWPLSNRQLKMRRVLKLNLASLIIAINVLSVCGTPLQTDPSIDTFWMKFRTAVIKGDKEAIATMVQFPITMPYGVPAIRTRAQLLKRYRDLFNEQADAVKCFGSAKPEVDPAIKNKFTVACKDAAGNDVVIYDFVKIRGVWKLESLDNINE
jgi:hypothetical protein